MRALVMGTALMLVGCQSEVQQAEKELEIVKADGDKTAICKAARKLADAWLKAQDQARYSEAKLHADTHCLSAQIHNGGIKADNMDIGVPK